MRFGFVLVAVLPFFAAQTVWFAARNEKRLAIGNLQRVLTFDDEKKAGQIAKRMCAHLARSLFECLELWRGAPVLNNVDFAPGSRESLENALASGKGCVMLTGHIGNWELMAAKYVACGIPTATFVKKSYDKRLDSLVNEFRGRYGIVSIDRDAPDAGNMAIELLNKGYLLGALIDQDTKVASINLPFFGLEARTPSGPAALALKAGASVVCGSIARVGNRHEISVSPIENDSDSGIAAQVAILTAKANQMLEQAIKRNPEQWVWFHRRWR